MAEHTYQQATTAEEDDSGRSGWTGWITFAGVIMVISGGLNALYGLVAVVNDEWVVWTNRASLYLDISQWGWVHLIVGARRCCCPASALFSGNILARTVGVIAASLSLIAQLLLHPGISPVGAHRDHARRPRDLGDHRPRQRDEASPEPGVRRRTATRPCRRAASIRVR